MTEFWTKWTKANEIEKVDLVKTLTLPSPSVQPQELFVHHCATLINSYLEDAVDFERKRIAVLLHDKGQPWIDCNLVYTGVDEIEEALR